VKSPYLQDLIPQALPAHREWIGTRLNMFTAAYNTKLVKKDELPRTYEDLLNPRWKGKLGIESSDLDWFAGVITDLGEAKGLKLFRDIVATNGISVRTGHTLLTNLVVSGEIPLALTIYNYKAEQLKNDGAPIDWFVLPPGLARPQGVGVTRRAPHPNAAVLFHDFMLSDAQEMFIKRDFVPTSRKIKTPLNNFPFHFIDPKVVLDETAKWTKLYREIITGAAK
jgi:iron(III) transport system substrate-binding protein